MGLSPGRTSTRGRRPVSVRGMVARDGPGPLRTVAEVGDQVGEVGGFQVVLQALGHQRLARRPDRVEVGAEDHLELPFLPLQGDRVAGLRGDQARDDAAVGQRGRVRGVAGVDVAVRVEDRREQGLGRGVGQGGQVRSDLVSLAVELVARGAGRVGTRAARGPA